MAAETFGRREPARAIVDSILFYEWPVARGLTIAEHFLRERGSGLDPADRLWLEAQVRSRFSIWEVLRVDGGRGLELVDAIGGARTFVHEMRASETLVARDVILARVVVAPDQPLLAGLFPQPLTPRDADAVVLKAKAEHLTPGWASTIRLLALWDEAVGEAALRAATPARVRNSDGHELVMIEDTWSFKKANFASVLSRLAALPGVTVEDEKAGTVSLACLRGTPASVVWSLKLTSTRATISTNSRERADELAALLSQNLGGLAKAGPRKETQLAPMRGGHDLVFDVQPASSSGLGQLFRSWLDQPSQALNGLSPRVAVVDAAHRPAVHLLLKEMENLNARGAPKKDGYDPKAFRRELGVDELGEVAAHHSLDRAVGFGRKISETLLSFSEPVLGQTQREAEGGLRFAIAVWNIVVAEERGWSKAEIARARAKIGPRTFSAELIRQFDALVSRKHDHHAGDLRMVGEWRLDAKGGLRMEALLPPDLIAQATAAGLTPSPR